MNLDEVLAKLGALPPEAQAKVKKEVLEATKGLCWIPNPGPQTEAYFTKADVLLYGGEAGGGKSGLLIGLALTQHKRSLLMRRQYTDLNALQEDLLSKYGSRKGFNGSPPAKLRTEDGRIIDLGAAKDAGDEESWQGQPHDFLGIDEASQFLESQVRFLIGWVRTTDSGQRCRVVLATNPPISPTSGQWLKTMFAPWLNPRFPNPAKPGELRWVISDERGDDEWVDGPEPVIRGDRTLKPTSRTFIPASLEDNPFLKDTDYGSRLDGLPEPLRSSIRDGNWMISHQDHEWQVIPTNWILKAQARWTPNPPMGAPMCAMAMDPAEGGADETVISSRYDWWFSPMIAVPGRETPDGSSKAALIVKHRRDGAEVVIDAGGGYGGSTIERLKDNEITAVPFKGAEASGQRTSDRLLPFYNKRAEVFWRLREALDPDQVGGATIALPPDNMLVADLTAQRWTPGRKDIMLIPKEKIKEELGRSPDRGDAVAMAWSAGPTHVTHGKIWREVTSQKNPEVHRGYSQRKRR